MENEVAKTTGTEVGAAQNLGAADNLTAQDCPLGFLTILQSNSALVKSDEGKQGTIINTADPMEVIGDKEKDVEFIVVGVNKYWVTTDPETLDFIGKVPAIHKNEKPYEEQLNGRTVKNTYTLGFFVVLPKDIKDGFAMPLELPLRSSSLKYGEQLALQIMKMGRKGTPSFAKVFSLGINPDMGKKGKNSWYLPTVKLTRDATVEEIQVATEFSEMYAKLVEQSLAKSEAVESENVSSSQQQQF